MGRSAVRDDQTSRSKARRRDSAPLAPPGPEPESGEEPWGQGRFAIDGGDPPSPPEGEMGTADEGQARVRFRGSAPSSSR
ncbi:hypothetical protein ACQY0O_003650 [Thecaphora frezii]